MASYTPEEIEEINTRAANEIQKLGYVTTETKQALVSMSTGVKGLTETMAKGFKGLGSAAMGLTKSLADGNIGQSVFNDSIDATSNALGDLVGMIPYVGGALKALAKGTGDYAQAVNKQADALFNSYQEMSKIGASGAGGITSIFENLQKLNLGVNELDKFVAIVSENSGTLASFGKTVGEGLDEFARISDAVQHSNVGREFREMGISVDEINKGIIGYTNMQRLVGGRQKMTTDELIVASKDYIREVDLLAKITGANRKEQEDSKESAMAEERYAGYKYELDQRAKMGDKAAAAQAKTVESTQTMLGKQFGPETRKGFLNILSGTINTPEAKKLLLSFPEAAAVAGKKVFEQGEFEAAMTRDMSKQALEQSSQLAQIGVNNKTYMSFQETLKGKAYLEAGTYDERIKKAKEQTKVDDANTKAIAATREKNMAARDNLQNIINAGIGPVTTAMEYAATATDAAADAMVKMANKLGVDVKPRSAAGAAAAKPAGSRQTAEERAVAKATAPGIGRADAKASAEKYLGKAISDNEFSALIKATHAEAAGGKKASQQEQAMIMASVINRARTDRGGIMGALTAKNQFQSVTGTANEPGPSEQYRRGPENDRLKSIEDATKMLQGISLQQKNFTAADAKAYGPGTNIGYRDKMLAAGGSVVGGSVFQTAPPAAGGYKFGGIANGPEAGYDTTLHGTEAVVPLPDGRTIPVQIAGSNEQMGLMSAQLSRLDDLVRVMQSQLGVSQKLLQYAQ